MKNFTTLTNYINNNYMLYIIATFICTIIIGYGLLFVLYQSLSHVFECEYKIIDAEENKDKDKDKDINIMKKRQTKRVILLFVSIVFIYLSMFWSTTEILDWYKSITIKFIDDYQLREITVDNTTISDNFAIYANDEYTCYVDEQDYIISYIYNDTHKIYINYKAIDEKEANINIEKYGYINGKIKEIN